MVICQTEIPLKNGKTGVLRCPETEDAAKLIEYLEITASETDFLLAYPEERAQMTLEMEERFIENVRASEWDLMLICTVDGKIAGNCHLTRMGKMKIRHRAAIAIALYREFWNLGIGTAMLKRMISEARNMGISQLELDYVDGNDRAKALYEKVGFRETGVIPNGIRLKDGKNLDLHMMVCML